MPPLPDHKMPIWAWLPLALCLIGVIYVVYRLSPYSVIILGAIAVMVCIRMVFWARHMRIVAASRVDESICTFVRSFDYRRTDPWILRAVYEELSRYLAVGGHPLPIRADDRWEEDFEIDPDDFADLVVDIAHRAGRSMADTEHNHLYGKVKTVRDIVRFLEHQPRIEASEDVSAAR
jgi:hypothetical protein